MRPLGIRLPIYPLKGYSLTLHDRPGACRAADQHHRLSRRRSSTPGSATSCASRAWPTSPATRRRSTNRASRRSLDETRAAFPEASDFSQLKPWCGLRPATPKGTPILGATRYPNLLLDCGQGALGFTLALACGRVIADIAAGRAPEVPLDGFTV